MMHGQKISEKYSNNNNNNNNNNTLLETEIWSTKKPWNVRAKVIPVIRGETGTISKSLRQ